MAGYKQGKDWCSTEPVILERVEGNVRLNKVPFKRCPKCKRRLQLKVLLSKDLDNELYYALPAHKLRKTKR